ncbi:hypothetical protein SAMN02745163_00677 [Clostridium cavendishii DSM 21758]|uniref:Uncharacterized protein n=1 Tax=Clostridium cavendishii DSM 21758 TaxID=1121302 RepID=A0A1M6DAV6_9CLOT|nr:hypothetical protein [Clostridium cavendishii]SHI70289.1 hypothetical protein SAMN02745163_00677 [Clostridium cavendishii DSM 21758]
MRSYLEPIKEDVFKETVNIRFNDINQGFSNFINGILEVDEKSSIEDDFEERFINFYKKVYEKNEVITDFYLKDIDETGVLKILEGLDYQDRLIILNELKYGDKTTLYFKIKDENIIRTIVSLSFRELLFCTTYFLGKDITIWGNYSRRFPVFFKDEEIIKEYKIIAKSCGLKISDY